MAVVAIYTTFHPARESLALCSDEEICGFDHVVQRGRAGYPFRVER
jgi:hypothetical protein